MAARQNSHWLGEAIAQGEEEDPRGIPPGSLLQVQSEPPRYPLTKMDLQY